MSTWRCTAPSPRLAASAQFPDLAAGGISAFKLSTYEYDAVRFPRIDHPTMLAAFREIAKTGLPVAIHNEDQELVEMLTAQARAEGRTEPIMHCRTRPPLAETMADLEIFEMALETGAHVHIAHSSLARGFEIAETFRGMGAQTTGEACIQYLCMTEDDIVRLGGKGKCNPPFRTADEVERMWQCLTGGQDRLCVHRSRAVADRAQDAAGHLRQWRRPDRAAELRAADVLAAGGARAAADADGDLLRRAQRADAWAVAEERRDPRRVRMPISACWSAAISCSMRRRSRIGRRCAGRRIMDGGCARASPRRICAAR